MRTALFATMLMLAACGTGESEGSGSVSTDLSGPREADISLEASNIAAEEGDGEEGSEVTPVRRLVNVGHDGPDFDACGGVGRVTNLNPDGDNYLSVRARPNAEAEELDRLGPQSTVWMCDGADNGWHGIVYHPDTGAGDCAVSSPVDELQPYSGPCRSGWVSDDYIELIAG